MAKSTAGWLTKAHGWRRVTRGRRVRTTVPDPSAARARTWCAASSRPPGQLHVADFTYVQMVTGRFAHTAFAIDTFTGLIPA